jgi:hypothetical protein
MIGIARSYIYFVGSDFINPWGHYLNRNSTRHRTRTVTGGYSGSARQFDLYHRLGNFHTSVFDHHFDTEYCSSIAEQVDNDDCK